MKVTSASGESIDEIRQPDVKRFADLLARLASNSAAADDETIAAGLFDWGRALIVSRAPGRLDVMGGIADYSGSLVLQVWPVRAACSSGLDR